MLIISKFKDYYDFVAHQYGIDNSVVYNRDTNICTYTDEQIKEIKKFQSDVKQDRKFKEYLFGFIYKSRTHTFEILYILGKIHLYIKEEILQKSGVDLNIVNYKYILRIPRLSDFQHLVEYRNARTRWYRNTFPAIWEQEPQTEYIYNNSIIEDQLQKLQLSINIPVFSTITHKPEVSKNTYEVIVPELEKIQGFPGSYPAHGLYKDLYNFFISTKANVDLIPPIEVDNISKIEKHGFDKRTSFRHPVLSKKN